MKSIKDALDAVHAGARTILTLGIVLVILGILSLLAPWFSGLVVQAVVGFFMIGAGIAWTVFSFHAHSWDSGLWEGLVGILSVISGVIMLAHPLISMTVLTLVLAAYFISAGILRTVFAFRYKPLPGWESVLISGVMSILLGLLISYQWPFSGLWAIGTLVGIDLLFGGFSLIRIGSVSENVLKKITGR